MAEAENNAIIVDGNQIAAKLNRATKLQVTELMERTQQKIGLAIIQVGDDASSGIYVAHKLKAAEQIGIIAHHHHLDAADVAEERIAELIISCNTDPAIHGIIVQLPLPSGFAEWKLLNLIDPRKDVDGLTATSIGSYLQQVSELRPCASMAIAAIKQAYNLDFKGLNATVIGSSLLTGQPIAQYLLQQQATVTLCHIATADLARHIRHADIVVSAIGKPGVIQSEWLKPGVIAFDIGTNRQPDGRVIGDLDFATAAAVASHITPCPGGIGPITVACLLKNTIQAAIDLLD